MLPAMPDRDLPPSADRIADGYWDALLALRPTLATYVGDDRFDDRLDDPGPAGRAAVRALHERTLAELNELGPDVRDDVTGDILRFVCEAELAVEASGWPLLESVSQVEGPQLLLSFMAQVQAFGTPDRVDRWLARLAAYPAFIDAHVERLREARDRGIVPARLIAERVVDGLERSLAAPAETSPLVTVPIVPDPADRDRIADAVRRSVQPADARLLAAIRALLPETRSRSGLVGVPAGDAMYAARIRLWTTLRSDPEDLHRSGLDDLDRLDEERRAITRGAGYGDDIGAYRRALASEPGNVPGSGEELLERMRDDLGRALAAAPGWFGRMPVAPCEVRPLDPTLAPDSLGHYMPPVSGPAAFYMNVTNLPDSAFSRWATITYHETIPGHHLQLAIEGELEGLSAFRRLGARESCGAYVEGWGLYSERLADEMGLYRSEGERFGMLDAQAWRAARLVADTGLHAFGWERDRAVDLFLERTGLDRAAAGIEVDRYLAMPAQALAYKVGQREIEGARSAAVAEAVARGSTLDIRRFHDTLLGHGSLPLEVMRARLPGWLAAD